MAIAYSEFLQQVVAGITVPWQNVWVRLVSNNTGTAYVSDAVTSSLGKFTFATKPPGDTYTVYTGPSNTGPWTASGDASYAVPVVQGENPAFQSVGAQASGSFTPTLPGTGGAGQPGAVTTPQGVSTGKVWDWGGGLFNVMAGAVLSDGVTDDTTALQDVLTGIATASIGGRAWMPRNLSATIINNTVYVPSRVQLVGNGRDSSYIKAGSTFPVSTAMINLGDAAHTIAFACRVEDMTIDANNVAGSICINSDQINEQSGFFRVLMAHFVDSGFKSVKSAGPGAQNYSAHDFECIGGTGAVSGTRGLTIDGTNQGSPWSITNFSIVFITGHETAAGAQLDGISCRISDAHVEHCTDGLLIGSVAGCTGILIENINGGPTVTNTVHISNATAFNGYTILGIPAKSATNTLLDDHQTLTITETVGFYAVGGGAAGVESLLTTVSSVMNRLRAGLHLTSAAPLRTDATLGAGNGASTAVTALAHGTGTGPANPNAIQGFWPIMLGSTTVWVPYFQ